MSHTLTTLNSGVFQVNSTGEVKIDYLYDGGFNKGQLAIFSLAGMENLMPGSLEFNLEAAKRALSSSTQGYVVINDNSDRARFSDVLTWEGNFNGGEYQGQKTFQLQANSTFAMMLISQGTIAQFLNNPNGSSQPLFSFANLSSSTGNIPQMVDITGKGNTFGWEDIRSATVSDRDYNDLVVQVSGATARATAIDGVISASRDWRNTVVGRDLINYANRLQLEKGIFEVNPTGQVKFDYLFDGGWFEGELGIFNLKGMERYEVGSVEFIKEASRRALSNSTEGRVVIQDAREGAKFSSSFSWENNFNKGNYKGVKSFTFNPGDQFAFMMVRNATIENLYHTSDSQNVLAKSPWFSIQNPHVSTDLSQFVAIDNHGTFGFEDIQATNADPNLDYNDIVFQVQGLTGSAEILDSKIDSSRDWRNSTLGINLLAYTARTQYSSGIFQVGKTGKLEYDFLFDGGWFQGELGVFSLAGLDQYTPGSLEFIKEAAKRALSNTTQGRILVKDASEGARFTQAMSWENNFNSGTYKGVRSIALTPGDEVAFMLIQHTNFQEIFNTPSKISQWGKLPIFSIPELNPGGTPPNQFVAVDDNGTFAFEDVRVDWGTSDQDYNDLIFQVKGVKGFAQSIDQAFNPERDWRKSSSGNSLLTYANRSFFDEGVLIASESGRVTVNYLYDGGTRQGELGIFSLMGMDSYEIGSRSFMQEALRRATSNSLQGRVIVNENIEGAKLDYTHDILWEGDYNSGKYVGEKVLQLTPGVAFGLVYSSNGLTDELLNPNGPSPEKLFFSMSKANLQQTDQITEVLSSGTISSTTSSTISAQSIQGLQAYNTVLSTQAGSTNEPIALKIEYGQDFNGDNLQDIKVSLRIVESAIDPVMGTEDMIGVAFDIGDDRLISILGLTIDNVFTSPNLGSPILNQNPVSGTNFLLGQNQINPPPGNFLGINVSGDPSLVLTPYDGIVKFGNGGLGTDGYVRQSSFVIAGNRDITGTLVTQILNGTDWYVRLQSTDGGGGSAKTVGVIGNIEAVNAEPVTILSLEDVHLNYGSNRDYNDIVVAFTGVQSVGFTPIDDVIQSDRNWQNTLVGPSGTGNSTFPRLVDRPVSVPLPLGANSKLIPPTSLMMPNFLIIGAAKAGTTALHTYLNQHPQIYMTPEKETNFFAFEGEILNFNGPGDEAIVQFSITDLATYQAEFQKVEREKAIGEACPLYLYSPKAPERIYSHLPQVRLIAILRNPVDRAYANFLHLIRDDREPQSDFALALQSEDDRIQQNWEWFWHYRQLGYYATQLQRYYTLFKSDQIRVYLYDDLRDNALGLVQDLFQFLEVDANFVPDMQIRPNKSGMPKNSLLHQLLTKPNPIKTILKPFFPASLRQKIQHQNLTTPRLSAEVQSQLTNMYHDDILLCQDLIGRDLSAWLDCPLN